MIIRKIILYFITILILCIINVVFSPNNILTLNIKNLPNNLEKIPDYNYDKNKFIYIDKSFSSFFDENKNLKNTIKYNSFIRHVKYHNQNKFDIIASKTLKVDNLISDLNIYLNKNKTIKENLSFKIISKEYVSLDPSIFIVQIFLFLLFLYLFKSIQSVKTK